MNFIDRILILCSTFLAIVTVVYTRHVASELQPTKYLNTTLPTRAYIKIGSGVEDNHLPIGVCSYVDDPNPIIEVPGFKRIMYEDCYIYTRTGQFCTVNIEREYHGVIKKVYQLADNKVLALTSVHGHPNPEYNIKPHDSLISIDMNTCVIMNVHRLDSTDSEFNRVVIHKDRFDFIKKNVIASYDANGNPIRGPGIFKIGDNSFLAEILPAPGRWSDEHLIVTAVRDGRVILSLVDIDGIEVKRLFEFRDISNYIIGSSESALTFCLSNFTDEPDQTTSVSCRIYDSELNLKYTHEMIFPGIQVYSIMRYSEDGSIVLYKITGTNLEPKWLHVTVKKIDREPVTSTYDLPLNIPSVWSLEITNFEQNDDTFEIACETFLPTQEHVVMLQNYKLPSM